jgi:adenosylhomocysteine nucleosidase
MKRVLVTAAVRQELSGLEVQLADAESLSVQGGYLSGALEGARVQLCLTGIGAARARRKLEAVLAEWEPDLILATGFGGGLTGRLRGGDIILAERVLEAASPGFDPRSLSTGQELLEMSLGVAVPNSSVHRGTLLTVPDVIFSAQEKRRLGSRYGADGVDMESFVILEIAGERGIPCIAARAVFDEVAFELPGGLENIPDPDGNPRLMGVLKLLLRRPWSIPRLYALRSRSARAAASLAAFVAGTLRRLERSGEDV